MGLYAYESEFAKLEIAEYFQYTQLRSNTKNISRIFSLLF